MSRLWVKAVLTVSLASLSCFAAVTTLHAQSKHLVNRFRSRNRSTSSDSKAALRRGSTPPGSAPLHTPSLPHPRTRRMRRLGAPRVPPLQGPALARAQALGIAHPSSAQRLLYLPPPEHWITAARINAPDADTSLELLWPVPTGRFGRGFGRRRSFRHPLHSHSKRAHLHQGIDILAPQGTPVLAAADGVVVYSHNRIRGYGTTVILVHPDGSVTLYAHCRESHVVPGQNVRKGEIIATVGQTGLAQGPHLHFEYRVGGRPVDPIPYLKRESSRIASLGTITSLDTNETAAPSFDPLDASPNATSTVALSPGLVSTTIASPWGH
ncbi:MAG: M23 family metallopeptidase [Sandaracinaceae bacterium]|nr:M23 family metallopeptidase [Sandaracinaceae bacterium]